MEIGNEGKARPFVLGLSLAGGVSAGAYIAGVVDFIVEALDAFQKARKDGDPTAPLHEVIVETVCGASAGSLTAAALGAALAYDFPHVDIATAREEAARNPLYDSWVNMTTAENLLGTEDRDDPDLRSLLDSTPLDRVTRKAIEFGEGLPRISRSWVANPLHVAFTVTNLRGVPFALGSRRERGLQMRMHADVMRFAICGIGDGHQGRIHPDEIRLSFPASARDKWSAWGPTFGNAALASAAFPALLAGRRISRPASDYDGIDVLLPSSGNRPAKAERLVPAWDAAPASSETCTFDAADGGIMDNDPIDIARAILNDRDVTKASSREGSESSQAVLMIDPLNEDGTRPETEAKPAGLLSGLALLFPALQNQARFRPTEIALAAQEHTYSRFLIVPLKAEGYGCESGRNVAGTSCGSFGGYLSDAFRRHDYLLGRQNAQRYLAEKLVLPEDNPLFQNWTPTQRRRYALVSTRELPIIPLIGSLHPHEFREPLPDWPRNRADLDRLRRPLEARLDMLWQKVIEEGWKPQSFLARLAKFVFGTVWKCGARTAVRTIALKTLRSGLRGHDLA